MKSVRIPAKKLLASSHNPSLLGTSPLELEVVEEKEAGDGSFKLVYLGDGGTGFRLELTWLRDRTEPYDLGEQEFHLAFVTDRFDALLARHRAMGCVCFENPDMGVYFIEDPDGYWIELVPERG